MLHRSLRLQLSVPPVPGDDGLAVGAAWLLLPPISSAAQELRDVGLVLGAEMGKTFGHLAPWHTATPLSPQQLAVRLVQVSQ